MQKIAPNIWFQSAADTEAAVQLYTSLFSNSSTGNIMHYDTASAEASGMSEGSVLTIDFTLDGMPFVALNGGPAFTLNPSISFFVSCDSEEEIDRLYAALSEGGAVLMPLQEYPFSKKFAWVADRFGVSWQFNLAPSEQKITSCLMYVGNQNGKAEEAMNLYTSLFPNSHIDAIARYTAEDGDTEGNIKHGKFTLNGQQFIAMDSGLNHQFTFNEAVSLMITCETQEEIDHYWNAFIADGGEESQCGWLKDKFGVSWQITPKQLNDMLLDADKEKAARAMQAMLTMKKLVIADLEKAFTNEA